MAWNEARLVSCIQVELKSRLKFTCMVCWCVCSDKDKEEPRVPRAARSIV